jgi:hypothetical protein
MCWQHARTWRHKWKSLTENQTGLFLLAVFAVVIGVPGTYFSYRGWQDLHQPKEEPAKPIDTVKPTEPVVPPPTKTKLLQKPKSVPPPPLPTPVIQTAPVYGNLKARCEALTTDISTFMQRRYSALHDPKIYPPPQTLASAYKWETSNDSEFRGRYLEQVKGILDELRGFHISDPALDGILKMHQSPTQFFFMHDIEIVNSRLTAMASELPQ